MSASLWATRCLYSALFSNSSLGRKSSGLRSRATSSTPFIFMVLLTSLWGKIGNPASNVEVFAVAEVMLWSDETQRKP